MYSTNAFDHCSSAIISNYTGNYSNALIEPLLSYGTSELEEGSPSMFNRCTKEGVWLAESFGLGLFHSRYGGQQNFSVSQILNILGIEGNIQSMLHIFLFLLLFLNGPVSKTKCTRQLRQ